MKILVVAGEIHSRQWLGRLLNEAGLADENVQFCDIQYLNSIDDCIQSVQSDPSGRCQVIIWHHEVCSIRLRRLSEMVRTLAITDAAPPRSSSDNLKYLPPSELDAPCLLGMIDDAATG